MVSVLSFTEFNSNLMMIDLLKLKLDKGLVSISDRLLHANAKVYSAIMLSIKVTGVNIY